MWADEWDACSFMGLRPTCTGVKRIRLRKPQVDALVAGLAWDFALAHETWWGTVVSSGDSSSAWIDVIKVVPIVPADVAEVRMS